MAHKLDNNRHTSNNLPKVFHNNTTLNQEGIPSKAFSSSNPMGNSMAHLRRLKAHLHLYVHTMCHVFS